LRIDKVKEGAEGDERVSDYGLNAQRPALHGTMAR